MVEGGKGLCNRGIGELRGANDLENENNTRCTIILQEQVAHDGRDGPLLLGNKGYGESWRHA